MNKKEEPVLPLVECPICKMIRMPKGNNYCSEACYNKDPNKKIYIKKENNPNE